MNNNLFTYNSILVLFAIAGFGIALWAGIKILRKRKTKSWLRVTALVHHEPQEDSDLPIITYCYSVNDESYQREVDKIDDSASMPGQTHPLVLKYPKSSTLDVFYDPQQPSIASLTKGAAMEDLILFSIGICAMLLGIYTIV